MFQFWIGYNQGVRKPGLYTCKKCYKLPVISAKRMVPYNNGDKLKYKILKCVDAID